VPKGASREVVFCAETRLRLTETRFQGSTLRDAGWPTAMQLKNAYMTFEFGNLRV
jgi:hypothetical protein